MLIRVTILLNLNAKRGTGLLILMTVFRLAVVWSFSTNKHVNDICPVASPFKMDQMSTFTPSLFDEEFDTNSKKSILHTAQNMCMLVLSSISYSLRRNMSQKGRVILKKKCIKRMNHTSTYPRIESLVACSPRQHKVK